MRLHVSAKADYGLRALLVIAALPDGGSIKTAEIANEQHMPLKFLENIMVELRRKGLVISLRGPTGGFRLRMRPEQITVADVLLAIDGPLAEPRGDRPADVPGELATDLQRIWTSAEVSVRSIFESVTLADILRRRLPSPRAMDPEPAMARP